VLVCACVAAATRVASCVVVEREAGFHSLFDVRTPAGWQLPGVKGAGYGVKNGVVFCERRGGGNLLRNGEYRDFIFQFEFRLELGSNNAVAKRAPFSAGPWA